MRQVRLTRNLPEGVARYLLLTLVVGVGVAATLLAVRASIDNASELAQRAFDQEVELRVLVSEDRIEDALEGIEEIGGLFGASSSVSVDEFVLFASQTINRHSEISAIGWAPVVPGSEREAFETVARSTGSVGFEILDYIGGGTPRAAASRLIYYPILYEENPDAVKFSPPESTVSVTVTVQSSSVRFDVHDQGRGIPQEQLARIFDRFYQVDASDARVYSGTGLGLAISKWIVDEHGGKIWVDSEVGTGSTFSFELPMSP